MKALMKSSKACLVRPSSSSGSLVSLSLSSFAKISFHLPEGINLYPSSSVNHLFLSWSKIFQMKLTLSLLEKSYLWSTAAAINSWKLIYISFLLCSSKIRSLMQFVGSSPLQFVNFLISLGEIYPTRSTSMELNSLTIRPSTFLCDLLPRIRETIDF